MKKILFTFIFGLFLVTTISSIIDLGTLKKGDCIQIRQVCDNCTKVYLTSITYPNSSTVYLNHLMTKTSVDYNYSFCNTTTTGIYSFNILGDKDGTNQTEDGQFEINPTGIEASESRTNSVSRAIYFTLVIGILFFVGFLFVKTKTPVKWTFFIFGIFFFLITLNLLFVGLQDEVVNPKIESFFDSFTAISFYIYWFLGGILGVMWFLTFLQTWLFNKNQASFNKYGSNY